MYAIGVYSVMRVCLSDANKSYSLTYLLNYVPRVTYWISCFLFLKPVLDESKGLYTGPVHCRSCHFYVLPVQHM